MTKKDIIIYTDGSARGNPGPGGYGVILRYGTYTKELSGGFRCTTNNRMELLAAIKALEALKEPCHITLHTDSQYLAKGITLGWAKRWRANGWMRTKTQPARNADLWDRLLRLLEKHDVEFVWVRGHAGDPLNQRCDQLAKEATERPNLPPDPGYNPERCHSTRRTQRR